MNSNLKFIESYLNQFINTIGNLDKNKIDNIVLSLKELRKIKVDFIFLVLAVALQMHLML